MSLLLKEEMLLTLKQLSGFQSEVVEEFARISVEFLKQGINQKVFSGAAAKLELEKATVEDMIYCLMFLFLEGVKLKLSDKDFFGSLIAFKLPEDFVKSLAQFYSSVRKPLRSILNSKQLNVPQYKDLQWRFDVEIGSRFLRNQCNPSFLMKLTTTNAEKEDSVHLMEVSPVNLVHMTEVLETAVSEMKSSHSRRMIRGAKAV